MVLGLTDWSPPDRRVEVLDMSEGGSWAHLAADYSHNGENPALLRVFEIAQEHGVVCIVREARYIDADWRSQLARFYTGAFRRYPSVCHRLHFFTDMVPEDLVDLSTFQDSYRGYSVIRPLPIAPVGRTMIVPPPALHGAARCEGDEEVNLVGWPLKVRAMPFISQDTQLMRCSHAAIWMVLMHGTLVHGLPRLLPADVHDAAAAGAGEHRHLPSDGLSRAQLLGAMQTLGLSPTRKFLPATKEDDAAGDLTLHGIICRSVNSLLPPIVVSPSHAWVVVAYQRRSGAVVDRHPVEMWRHDDSRGPYLQVSSPWDELEEAHTPWRAAYLPLVPKAYLDAETAEAFGLARILSLLESGQLDGTRLQRLNNAKGDRAWTVRTYLITSNAFKRRAGKRGLGGDLAAAYRLSPMSRYIWVVELVDRQARDHGAADVFGEIVLDATVSQHGPPDDPERILAAHVDTFAYIAGVDQATSRQLRLSPQEPYETACPALARAD